MMPQEPPFHYLCNLEQTLLARARVIPLPQEPVRDWTGILFRSHQQIFLTPLEEMKEILRVRHLATIPRVKPWLRGLIPCRGEIYPVTDLAAFLVNKLAKITDKSRILITKQQEEYFGLLVDEVVGLEHFSKESNIKDKILAIPFYEPYLSGTLVKESKEFPILNIKALVEHPHFRDVALRAKVIADIKE